VAAGCVLWATVSIENHEWVAAFSATSFTVGAAILLGEWAPIEKLSAAWGGLGLIILGGCALIVSGRYFNEWFERLAIVPLIAGTIWLVCGRRVFWWSLPAILFLTFMVPLPFTLEAALRNPLRSLGTTVSTYVMQTIGLPAYSEGFVIAVGESRIGVVEACSGLRMLMVFIALSAALVLLIDRPWWQRGLLLLGALPVALISNILRITVTGICYANGWEHLADLTFHDLAGWLMMPVGILLLLAELWFLDRLFLCETHRPMSAGLSPAEARFQG
jgi:exosortase